MVVSIQDEKRFDSVSAQMRPSLEKLLTSTALEWSQITQVPTKPGIYFLSEGDKAIYVGQTRNLRTRLRQHAAHHSTRMSATLAFLIAKVEATEQGIDTKRFGRVLEADKLLRSLPNR